MLDKDLVVATGLLISPPSAVLDNAVMCKGAEAPLFGTDALYVAELETWLILQSCSKNC